MTKTAVRVTTMIANEGKIAAITYLSIIPSFGIITFVELSFIICTTTGTEKLPAPTFVTA